MRQFTPEFIREQRKLANVAGETKTLTVMRYDHGGGRVYFEFEQERHLVADFYNAGDREYWIAAANHYPAALDEIERLNEAWQVEHTNWVRADERLKIARAEVEFWKAEFEKLLREVQP
jgi:hypothetical protein